MAIVTAYRYFFVGSGGGGPRRRLKLGRMEPAKADTVVDRGDDGQLLATTGCGHRA